MGEYVDNHGILNEGHDDHYMEVEFFQGSDRGRGTYIVACEVRGTFEFTHSRSGSTFDAWYVSLPNKRRFVLTPVRGASGDIVGLSMTFADAPKFEARFANSQSNEDICWPPGRPNGIGVSVLAAAAVTPAVRGSAAVTPRVATLPPLS